MSLIETPAQPKRPKPERLRAPLQEVYTDPARLALEQERIFDRDWVMVGRQGLILNPGDYMTAAIGRRPVLIVRQKDGSIRAFANYCLHRYARLAEGCGHARRIVCPYHAWTYDISGRLIGVTDRDGFDDLGKGELGLKELACEVWNGFVFVSLQRDLEPVAKRLAPLGEMLVRYELSTYEDRHVVHEEVWSANWKIVYENFVETYHVTYAHKGSIGPTNPTALAEIGPSGHKHFSIHHNPYRPEDLPEVHNGALDADERRRLHVIGVYPNGLIAIDANFVWWMMLEPMAIDRTNGRWGCSYSPKAMAGMKDPEKYVAAINETVRIANEEDKAVTARVQQGVAFGAREQGFLHSRLEIYVDEFRRYVERMTG
jgi:phenylpropionate dioxygenase-like ring-hydroxylating dioxygenase large terminal subunit